MFQHEVETHAQVSKSHTGNNITPTVADIIPADADYWQLASCLILLNIAVGQTRLSFNIET